MALPFSGEKYRHLNDDDYRSYLFARNQVPIVSHSYGVYFKRFRMHARATANRLDGVLHRMIEALAAAKMRRLTRELAFHSVRYHRSLNKRAHGMPNSIERANS